MIEVERNQQAHERVERAMHSDEHNRLNARLNREMPAGSRSTFFQVPVSDYSLKPQEDTYFSKAQSRRIIDNALSEGHQPSWNPGYHVETNVGKFSYEERKQPDPFAGQESLSVDKLLYKIGSR